MTQSPWRAWRETIPKLTMNEVGRRAAISSGRLSIIERGVPPTDDEAARLRAVLVAAGTEKVGHPVTSLADCLSADRALELEPDEGEWDCPQNLSRAVAAAGTEGAKA